MIRDKILFAMMAMVCVTFIEVVALLLGHNGAILASSFGLLGAICGYVLKHKLK